MFLTSFFDYLNHQTNYCMIPLPTLRNVIAYHRIFFNKVRAQITGELAMNLRLSFCLITCVFANNFVWSGNFCFNVMKNHMFISKYDALHGTYKRLKAATKIAKWSVRVLAAKIRNNSILCAWLLSSVSLSWVLHAYFIKHCPVISTAINPKTSRIFYLE